MKRPYDPKREKPLRHLYIAIVVGVGIVVAHVLSHLWARDHYTSSIKTAVTLAAQVYQIRYDAASGEFRIYQGGALWASLSADQQVGPLGIGRSPSFRGLMTDRDRALSDLSREPRSRLLAFLATFREIDGARVREIGGSGGEWLVCIPRDRFVELQSLDLRAAILRARELIDAATVYKRGIARRAMSASEAPVTQAVAARINATLTKLEPLGLEPQALPLERRNELLEKLPLAFLDDKTVLALSPSGVVPPPRDEPSNRRDELTNAIVKIAEKEVLDCFWMFGCLRWIEIVFWVWFGVVTKMLYGYGMFAVGRMKGRVFEPNETHWALARFVFAPLLALVFFWITSLTNLVDFGVDLSQPSMATLAFAFLMGMFPDNIYTVVSDLFHRVLKGSETDDRADPTKRSIELPGATKPGATSLLADLRSRLQDVVTSVVRPVPPR